MSKEELKKELKKMYEAKKGESGSLQDVDFTGTLRMQVKGPDGEMKREVEKQF